MAVRTVPEPTRYSRKQLHEEAKRIAKDRGGRLLDWEVVVGDNTALVVYFEVRTGCGKRCCDCGTTERKSTNMAL